ncbi:MAG: dipeptide ABC transporter ATP-binding protein [Cocleimonas sp.]|nr:dipeptide ABC transporter ATP-binding protein [Cocleimonas sp.]
MALLSIENLQTHLRVGKKEIIKAVDGINLEINKGETYCLVGESGSGKSICALSVIQLLPTGISLHPEGKILFDWAKKEGGSAIVDTLTLEDDDLRKVRGASIAMIFQEPMTSLNPVLNIGEQIVEAIQLHHPDTSDSAAKAQAIEAMDQVQIKDAARRFSDFPHQLSGGQRQRIMIAMALACKPDLLIADEPTTALDVTVQAEILTLMKDLQKDIGMSILFITHDFGVVAQMAHTVGVMKQGKIVEQGKMRDVLMNPQHEYTQKLLASVPENLEKPAKFIPEKNHADDDNVFEIKDLNVWFPIRTGVFRKVSDHIRAVDGVDLNIKRGTILSLVGESGCGKTTLGRAIIQLQEPTSGSVKLDGEELVGLSNKELVPYRKRMQIAFQDPQSSLNPRLQIVTTLIEPMTVHGIGENKEERIERAAKVLEEMQLKRDHLWRYPHEFSGGQKQRIGLARALVLSPEFIVCDEITSALDVSVQAEILQLLLEIRKKQDLTLLFITHNIAVVEYLSDETVVMKAGKIVEQGLTTDVCGNPQQAYTQKLLEAVPRLNL